MFDDGFVGFNILSFKNEVTKDSATLISGTKGNKPHYRINSKVIPITGEFTGYPVSIMIKWFEGMGYKYLGKSSLVHNQYVKAV